jgi:hypothetical protein
MTRGTVWPPGHSAAPTGLTLGLLFQRLLSSFTEARHHALSHLPWAATIFPHVGHHVLYHA